VSFVLTCSTQEDAIFADHRRDFARPMPPARAISTVHKAKGLECQNALLIPVDGTRFGNSDYARCRLYVALSRADTSLTLVLSRTNPSSLVTS
jgi:DNA helicase-2/ATP-dependent DNA helicase PcrA